MNNQWANLKPKTQKRLSETSWFHGTTYDQWGNICNTKIQVKHNITKSNELDFGYGFYLTDSPTQARDYIWRYIKNGILSNEDFIVLEFHFCPADYLQKNWLVFESYDNDFAEFIFHNRLENIVGSQQHHFDWIYGGMSDSKPTQIMAAYRTGELTKHEAIAEFRKGISFKQLSIHSQEICNIMQLKSATRFRLNEQFEIIAEEELNINEYNQL